MSHKKIGFFFTFQNYNFKEFSVNQSNEITNKSMNIIYKAKHNIFVLSMDVYNLMTHLTQRILCICTNEEQSLNMC